jgi:YXWGXW repeat-containing protein
MKKIIALAVMAATLATGCLVRGRHGHVAIVPPPALLIAGAIVAATARPGYVWVEGHWDWVGDRWQWSDGEWIEDRPGFDWIQGAWILSSGSYFWRPGHWRHR